jgi:hypothetical protein
MAIVIEDGTGLADAEAYISVADADTYFAARGNAAWAALTEPQKEQALRLGTDYMGQAYGQRWCGTRTTTTQALDWPRTGACGIAADVVPVAVKRANAELAVRASAGVLLSDQGAQVKQEVVGPISVTYADGARQDTRYAAVDSALASAGLLCRGGGQIPLVRA